MPFLEEAVLWSTTAPAVANPPSLICHNLIAHIKLGRQTKMSCMSFITRTWSEWSALASIASGIKLSRFSYTGLVEIQLFECSSLHLWDLCMYPPRSQIFFPIAFFGIGVSLTWKQVSTHHPDHMPVLYASLVSLVLTTCYYCGQAEHMLCIVCQSTISELFSVCCNVCFGSVHIILNY